MTRRVSSLDVALLACPVGDDPCLPPDDDEITPVPVDGYDIYSGERVDDNYYGCDVEGYMTGTYARLPPNSPKEGGRDCDYQEVTPDEHAFRTLYPDFRRQNVVRVPQTGPKKKRLNYTLFTLLPES